MCLLRAGAVCSVLPPLVHHTILVSQAFGCCPHAWPCHNLLAPLPRLSLLSLSPSAAVSFLRACLLSNVHAYELACSSGACVLACFVTWCLLGVSACVPSQGRAFLPACLLVRGERAYMLVLACSCFHACVIGHAVSLLRHLCALFLPPSLSLDVLASSCLHARAYVLV